jgi:hypothetical protein
MAVAVGLIYFEGVSFGVVFLGYGYFEASPYSGIDSVVL